MALSIVMERSTVMELCLCLVIPFWHKRYILRMRSKHLMVGSEGVQKNLRCAIYKKKQLNLALWVYCQYRAGIEVMETVLLVKNYLCSTDTNYV